MAMIISGIALVVSMIALWIAAEARDKSRNEIGTFAQACIGPLRQELAEAQHRVDELTRNHNRLAKAQVSNVEEVIELRREISNKAMPPKELTNENHSSP